MKRKIKISAFPIFNNIFLFFVFLLTLYPFIYVLAISLSDPHAVMQNKVILFPVGLNFNAFKVVLANTGVWSGYKNTLLYTLTGTTINLFFTSTMAYALSKPELYGRKFWSIFVIFTMFFQGGMIPNYLVINQLKIIDTIWAVTLPVAISTWNLMVMRTYFSGLPAELEEAAIVDGCSPIMTFVRIIIPLSMPIIVTMALFYSVSHWNSYMNPFIYLNDKAKFPLQIILRQILISGDTSFADNSAMLDDPNLIISDTIKYATIIVSILPVVLFYPFLQKFFVKGVMIGAVKG